MSYRLVGYPTCENHSEDNIVTKQEESMTYRIVNLSNEVVNLIMTNPEKAKTLAKVFMFIGIIGVGILAITHFID
jgi:secreted Zn-dependent insulinase-like peptidase